MADSGANSTFKVSAISLCGVTINNPVGGSIKLTTEKAESNPGSLRSVTTAIKSVKFNVTAKAHQIQAFVTAGTVATSSFTLTKMAKTPGTITVTITDTMAEDGDMNFDSTPHEWSQSAQVSSETENLTPVSVA